MSEIDDVLAVLSATGGRDLAVATVVAAHGSTYRREGARLVVSADGREVVGNISGGCLEGDVITTAVEVLESGRSRLLAFDLTADDEAVWGWGLGCNGAIEVLVEPGEVAARFAGAKATARQEQRGVVLATMVEGSAVGARMLVDHDGKADGGVGSAAADETLRRLAVVVAATGRSATRAVGDGDRVFFEVVAPRPRLVVCGAGHDAVPLVGLADRMGWRVEVVDDRPGLLSASRFPGVSRLVQCQPLEAAGATRADGRTSVVVMSHNFLRDADYLRSFLAVPLAYLGVLGPRARLVRLADETRRLGGAVAPEVIDGIHSPAGLDIGAEGPDEIALAIVSELMAARAGHQGGPLRDRPGPIHRATPAPAPLADSSAK